MKAHGGFTLIELLVVVTIIAILLMMLMPTMGRARDLTRQTVCLANQGLIIKGVISYHAEWQCFPINYGSSYLFERWWGGKNAYPPYVDNNEYWALGLISPYLPGGMQGRINLRGLDEGEFPACYVCPSADLDTIYLWNPSDKYHACYWTSIFIRSNRGWGKLFDASRTGGPSGDDTDSGGPARSFSKLCAGVGQHWRSLYIPRLEHVPNPAATMFSGDANDVAFDGMGNYDSDPGDWPLTPGWGWGHGSMGFSRHMGVNMAVGYLDGRAATVNRRQLDAMGAAMWQGGLEYSLDFMVRFPASMSCDGSRFHKLPESVLNHE